VENEFPASLENELNARGHKTKRRGHIGLVNAVGIDPQSGERLALPIRAMKARRGY